MATALSREEPTPEDVGVGRWEAQPPGNVDLKENRHTLWPVVEKHDY